MIFCQCWIAAAIYFTKFTSNNSCFFLSCLLSSSENFASLVPTIISVENVKILNPGSESNKTWKYSIVVRKHQKRGNTQSWVRKQQNVKILNPGSESNKTWKYSIMGQKATKRENTQLWVRKHQKRGNTQSWVRKPLSQKVWANASYTILTWVFLCNTFLK